VSYSTVLLLQVLLSALTVVLYYKIGSLLFGNRWVGFWAALLISIYFPYVYFPASVLTECLFMFLAALAVHSGVLASSQPLNKKRMLLTGALFGLATLTRPAGIALVPGLFLWYFVQWRYDIGTTVKNSLLIVVGLLIVMAPWFIRSQMIHNQVVPFTIMGAKQMVVAYNPEYKGDFYIRRVWWNMLWYDPHDSEIVKYNKWNQEALQQIKEYPRTALQFTINRFFGFWRHEGGNRLPELHSLSFFRGLQLISWLLFPLSLVGVIVSVKNWRNNLLLYLTLFDFTLFHAIAGARERYRLPIDGILFLFGGYCIFFLFRLILSNRRRGLDGV
jgi:4-amino-4-deoxy-L-arabinose transferase-like glycosyltransferase